eukprot:776234-Pyramimonas_sp.AAC.1
MARSVGFPDVSQIQTERSQHQLELENRSLHAKWREAEDKYVALNELTARETELLTNKLQPYGNLLGASISRKLRPLSESSTFYTYQARHIPGCINSSKSSTALPTNQPRSAALLGSNARSPTTS